MVRRQWLAERPPPPLPGATASESRAAAERSAPEPLVEPPSVPPGSVRARALDGVARVGSTFRLTASLAPADPSQLSIRFADGRGVAFTLYIERARVDGQYYQRRGRLGLWHGSEQRSGGENPPWATPLLKAVTELLLSPQFDGIADELAERSSSPVASPSDVEPTDSVPAPEMPVSLRPDRAESAPPRDPDHLYARPVVLGAEDVERFFHVDYEYDEGADVDQPPTTRIGIVYQCNQTCTFCQLAEMNTHIPPARIYAALAASRAHGACRVILTGGEPTLCRYLADYVRYARERGFTTIEMQTNAVVLDNLKRAERLHEAGLTDAQVSLHGPDSEISDRLTAAPGTHRRTLAGITNLLDVGVRVLLNHLVFRDNCHLLLEFVDMVEDRWGQHRESLILQFHSPLNEFARLVHGRKHIARYSEYASLLRQAIDRARALGYRVQDLQDPTGVPALCVLGADADYLGPILSQRLKPRFHRWESGWVMRVTACQSCEITDACMGVPKAYVALHGEDEFRPIRLT
jgi:sulfatase maturation enzyme AslB (radical SAM superfamily)